MAGGLVGNIGIATGQAALQQKAARRILSAGIDREIRDAMQIGFCCSGGGWRGEHAFHEAFAAFVIAFQHGAEQTFLAAETGIEAGRVDTHGGREVAHRRAFITVSPKNRHRPVEGVFYAKPPGTSRPHGCLP